MPRMVYSRFALAGAWRGSRNARTFARTCAGARAMIPCSGRRSFEVSGATLQTEPACDLPVGAGFWGGSE